MSAAPTPSADNANQPSPSADRTSEGFFREVNIEFLIHELKDPLSVVESNAQILFAKTLEKSDAADTQSRCIDRILRHSRRARAMLWELLEVGRAENACFDCRTFKPAVVLRQLLPEVIEAFGGLGREASQAAQNPQDLQQWIGKLGIRLDIVPSAEDIDIHHDVSKFRQIAANLLKNALHYRRRQVIVHLGSGHDHLTVVVRDDGPGVAPEHHQAIFERYKQLSPPSGVARSGHGLGLAIARIIARTMGGDITLESQLGQGAVFRLNLPLQMKTLSTPGICAAPDYPE
jgi:signal transduction histidine kinase